MAGPAGPDRRDALRALRLEARDFRNLHSVAVALAPRLTVVAGPNGAGKTNLLEAAYFACTARSPRTSNERELVRRGQTVVRVALETVDDDGGHRIEIGFEPGQPKRVRVDGRAADLTLAEERPLASVFMPERLELVKGAPAARRGHLDRLVAALWPARAETRSAYSRALSQRNALLARSRGAGPGADTLVAWDVELARHGVQLMSDRAEATSALRSLFAARAAQLGLPDAAELRYRPRSSATDAAGLARELEDRRAADLERGFTAHGPHRDEIGLTLGGLSLRAYGSQGQQRAALLALLFAERDLLLERRGRAPLMLLDDVMSELDAARRTLLAELLRDGGQALVTTTDADHVPGARDSDVELVRVLDGAVIAADEPVEAVG